LLAGIITVYHLWLHVNPTTVALTLLLLVLLLAARFGLRYAVATSIVATAAYNFYFLPPIGTFIINDPQNWIGLFAFLTVAVVGSRLSERAREEAEDARRRQRELEVLYGLSRELLQTENVAGLLNSIPSSIMLATRAFAVLLYLLEGDRRYLSGDDSTIRAAGMQDDDVSLRQLALTLPGPDRPRGQASCRIPLKTGVRPRGLLLMSGASFSVATMEAIGGLISISIDRAQALQSVSRADAAKESERLRSLMIDSITNELRTPLATIKTATASLLHPDGLDANLRQQLLSQVDSEVDRLNRLVAEAIEMAQLDAQEVHMTFVPAPVEAIVSDALAQSATALTDHPVRIQMPPLPPALADPAYITKVVCNLIENAAKYSAPGSPIAISAERVRDTLRVSVADRGTGIDSSEQALVFERFYRASTQARQTSGTGMGLAISRSIVEAHNGTLTVTSQLGEGSVFTFTLPVASRT
jgi:two-component system sensor histidine kinase KdpD